jgi:hypothetical protein
MLRRPIDVTVLMHASKVVLDAVVVHEVQNLLASTRGSETAGTRDTRSQGECEDGHDRDEDWGGAETQAGAG